MVFPFGSVLLYTILSPPFDRPTLPPPLTYFPILLKGWYWQSHFSVTDTSQPSAERWCIQWHWWVCHKITCCLFEDPHHIFTLCPHFTHLRTSRASDLHSHITLILPTSSVSPATRSFIVDRVIRVQSLFSDSDVWPAHSLYYFGVSPPLFPLMLHQPQLYARVGQECHTSSIRPTTQFGLWLVANGLIHHSYSRLHLLLPFSLPPSITLPAILSRILTPLLLLSFLLCFFYFHLSRYLSFFLFFPISFPVLFLVLCSWRGGVIPELLL